MRQQLSLFPPSAARGGRMSGGRLSRGHYVRRAAQRSRGPMPDARVDQLSFNMRRAGGIKTTNLRIPPNRAVKAGTLGGFLKGKRGLAVGGGALAFGMYEMGKKRSTGRNGIQPSSSGGM